MKGHTIYSCVSPSGPRVPGGYGQTSFLLSRGPRPKGGALVTTPRPMVPCAPALLLVRRLGSFFKLRRRVVAWFPRLRAETTSLFPRLPLVLVRDRRLGESELLVESGDAELLVGHAGIRRGRWASGPRRSQDPPAPPRRSSTRPGLDFPAVIVMASQPNSSAKKKEEKGKNIQVVVRCR